MLKKRRKKHLLEVTVPLTRHCLQSGGKYYIPANKTSSKHHQNDKQQSEEGIHSEYTQMLVMLNLYTKNPSVHLNVKSEIND